MGPDSDAAVSNGNGAAPLNNGPSTTNGHGAVPANPLVQDHPEPLKIAIVGAGIGGLSAAIGLRQQGHVVNVRMTRVTTPEGSSTYTVSWPDIDLRTVEILAGDWRSSTSRVQRQRPPPALGHHPRGHWRQPLLLYRRIQARWRS